MALVAAVDRGHERLSGPATRCILQREYEQYGNQQYERLARSAWRICTTCEPARATAIRPRCSRPAAIAIGERRKPDPQGRPGFLRVDTVHQGDWDGAKDVYHINAADTVTQWQVVACTSKISEASCSDFTKSRACRSQDNALVEGKNGAVVRKRIGYGYIAGERAEAIGKFYARHLNPYLNFHRPCGFATVSPDERGKRQRQYETEDYRTPYEKLKSRPEQYFKPGPSVGGVGTKGAGDERHRVRTADVRRQVAAAAAMQSAVSASAVPIGAPGP
jgi:hypothetical protein